MSTLSADVEFDRPLDAPLEPGLPSFKDARQDMWDDFAVSQNDPCDAYWEYMDNFTQGPEVPVHLQDESFETPFEKIHRAYTRFSPDEDYVAMGQFVIDLISSEHNRIAKKHSQ